MFQIITINKTEQIRWVISGMEHYAFTDKKTLINCKTGRIIKRTLIGYTQGYYWVE